MTKVSRKEQGYVWLGNYRYAKELKNRLWALYEGQWGKGENSTVGLEVRRDNSTGKPLRFKTLESILAFLQ